MYMLTINLKITLEAPLHVGTGDVSASTLPITRDVRGRPCIRASTLKGIHRAATEQVAIALGLSVCNAPFAQQMCQPLAGESACAVCRIFGSPWLLGRLFYRDLTTGAASAVDKRIRAAQSRRRRVRLSVYEQQYEILLPAEVFSGQINHLLSDNGLLALALAGLRAITTIGAGRATGYGLCRIEATALDSVGREINDSALDAALERIRVRP